MTVSIYKVTFNSNHSKVAMKTTIWIHEDVLDSFKDNIANYAKRKGFLSYTEQQIFSDQYLQAYRALLEKYEKRGMEDSHIKSIKDEYQDILLKNNLLEKFHFFVAPKHLDPILQTPKIDMQKALQNLQYMKGSDGIIKPTIISDWVGYHERQTSRTLRMEIR